MSNQNYQKLLNDPQFASQVNMMRSWGWGDDQISGAIIEQFHADQRINSQRRSNHNQNHNQHNNPHHRQHYQHQIHDPKKLKWCQFINENMPRYSVEYLLEKNNTFLNQLINEIKKKQVYQNLQSQMIHPNMHQNYGQNMNTNGNNNNNQPQMRQYHNNNNIGRNNHNQFQMRHLNMNNKHNHNNASFNNNNNNNNYNNMMSMDENKMQSESQKWKCKRCTLENDVSRDECVICEQPKDSNFSEEQIMIQPQIKKALEKPMIENDKEEKNDPTPQSTTSSSAQSAVDLNEVFLKRAKECKELDESNYIFRCIPCNAYFDKKPEVIKHKKAQKHNRLSVQCSCCNRTDWPDHAFLCGHDK